MSHTFWLIILQISHDDCICVSDIFGIANIAQSEGLNVRNVRTHPLLLLTHPLRTWSHHGPSGPVLFAFPEVCQPIHQVNPQSFVLPTGCTRVFGLLSSSWLRCRQRSVVCTIQHDILACAKKIAGTGLKRKLTGNDVEKKINEIDDWHPPANVCVKVGLETGVYDGNDLCTKLMTS